jgi:hypothetical protein
MELLIEAAIDATSFFCRLNQQFFVSLSNGKEHNDYNDRYSVESQYEISSAARKRGNLATELISGHVFSVGVF